MAALEAYDRELQSVKDKTQPSIEDLVKLCGLLEKYELSTCSKTNGATIKSRAQSAVSLFVGYPGLRGDENMLRIFACVGRYSEKLGVDGIYDMCEKRQYFTTSYKFHRLWAESHAQKRHAQRFREILELTRKRITDVAPQVIEADFQALAHKFLPEENIFPPPKKRDARRRSQVDVLQQCAQRHKDAKLVAPEKNTKLAIKGEFIDKVGYIPVSFEELCAAKWDDDNYEVVDMDISVACDMTVPGEQSAPIYSSTPMPSRILEAIKIADTEPPMTPIHETSEPESSLGDTKKMRFYSPDRPAIPPKFVNPLSSRASATSHSPVSFREDEYNKAAAVFSDTVNLGAKETRDATMPVETKPQETFQVYEDPEQSVVPAPVFAAPERRALTEITSEPKKPTPRMAAEEVFKKPTPSLFDLDLSDIENEQNYNYEDEPTLAGQRFGLSGDIKPTQGIVTSTPAPNTLGQKITPEDFFSAPIEQNFGFLKKRQSIAGRADLRSAAPVQTTPPQPETTISTAMAKMSVQTPPVNVEEEEEPNILEKTGINKPRESIIGNINPWDSTMREKIMARVNRPLFQHEYQTSSPKISRNREVILGGMKFLVVDLVGEGGFAKVFHCVDDETNESVALKYEVPSCAWEVYICNQVRIRLDQDRTPTSKRTMNCVMKISDAFIFKNSSVLINDFLPHGTLLNMSDKFKGGAHSQLILLMAIHIATVIRDVHACQIIHGDVKPDNIMILGPVDENWTADELLSKPLLKFIDWGRAIDMSGYPKDTSFRGRAGTACFDCPEMLANKQWNYQTDFFGFVSTMHVFIFGKYCKLLMIGRNAMDGSLKRRISCRDTLINIFDRLLNIPSCSELPSWDKTIQEMTDVFRKDFSAGDWRAVARSFNQHISTTL